MKKYLLILVLVFFSAQSYSQIHFGVKAGVNYNSDSFKNVTNDVLDGAKSKTGYHAGIWFRGKLPIIGLYLRPEIVYTELKNEVVYDNSNLQRSTDFSLRKIDIPVLLGKKVFGIGNVYIGPSFQYVLGTDFSLSDLSEVSTDDFSVGLQFGGGIELGKLGIDIRWERAFSDTETKFLDGTSPVNFDTRVNQIIVGLTYRL